MGEAPPIYPQVVVGYEENERGEDARELGERIVERDGGELKVIHVEKGSPSDALQGLAERGDADLIVLGSTHRAHVGSVAPSTSCMARAAACSSPRRDMAAPITRRIG
jgi:nucleotide-binding universal stress UspA family protein